MALVAEIVIDCAERIGVEARHSVEPDGRSTEFALSMTGAWYRSELTALMLRRLRNRAKTAGGNLLHGEVLESNTRAIRFARKPGLVVRSDPSTPEPMQVELQF
jgi:acetyltransferase